MVGDEVVDDGLTARVIEVFAIDEEIAIGGASPAPVEMEQIVLVVTVTDESVAALTALARIINRDLLVDIRLQQGDPCVVTTALRDMGGMVGVGKISIDGAWHVL